MLKTSHIEFSSTALFSNLIIDYWTRNDQVNEFYSYSPSIDQIEAIIKDKEQESIDRKLLVDVIKKQYRQLNINESVQQHIKDLESQRAFCIVTAHQLNIFTGPLYYIYKIAQTISTCRQLKHKYPSYQFIPVYWMGSEDHDFEEINHISLFNKKIEWTDKQGGVTGAYSTDTLLSLIDEIQSILGDAPYTNELIQLFKNAYTNTNLTEATRYLVNELFGEYGLVVIDGNDAALKQQFVDVMQDELTFQHSFKLVSEQIEKLESKGYKQQAHPRAINLFYVKDKLRERILKEQSDFKINNTELSFSAAEIFEELNKNPERFSPNVILRPLYQQKILPALAYIGGAGELAYWLQLKPLFDFYKVNFPQLLLRNSVLMYSAVQKDKAEKLGVSMEELFGDIEQLKKKFIASHTEDDIDVELIKNELTSVFFQLQEITKKVDHTLVNTVGAELQKAIQGVDSIQKRLIKSLKQKNETQLNQLEKLKVQLFPGHSLQERVENFAPYYAKFGKAFIENLIEEFDVYNRQFLLIQYS